MSLRRIQGLVASVGLSAAVVLAVGPAASEALAKDTAVAGPAVALAELPAGCTSQFGRTPFDSFRGLLHCLQAWTEYNPSTCKPISSGKYTTVVPPKHGKLTYGVYSAYLSNGACPGKKFPFGIAYYTWTDASETAKSDSFKIDWETPDHNYHFSFPMTAVLAPRIIGKTVVWRFKNEKPAGYATEITLSAQPAGLPSYTWTVAAGATHVKLDGSKTSTTKLTGVSGSTALNDVKIYVTANGSKSNPFKLTVKKPKTLELLSNVDNVDANWQYVTFVHYKILDQFGKTLPSPVPLNEHWTSGVTADWAGMDWRRGDAGGATVGPSDWVDQIQGELLGYTPKPLNPMKPLGAAKVYHWRGEWSIGSADPSGGKGQRVQINTWQKYRDHARHTDVVSPADAPNGAADRSERRVSQQEVP